MAGLKAVKQEAKDSLDASNWSALNSELRSTGALTKFARNSRTHSDEQINQIVASIKEFGFTIPILVDEKGMVIAGHARLTAADRLALPEVPVIVARGWSEAQKRAYVIADNKLAMNAGWDLEILGSELASLMADDFEIATIGFDMEELASLLGGDDHEDEGEFDSLGQSNSIDKKGEYITFGDRQIMLTDAEFEELNRRCDAHLEEYGMLNGFVGKLLDV